MKKILIIRTNHDYDNLFKDHSKFRLLKERGYTEEPDVVIYTGGPDVSPSLYGEKQLPCTRPSPAVEERYKGVYEKHPNAYHVGICFGGQWLNVVNGGAMWQDIKGHALYGTHLLTNLLQINSGLLICKTFEVTSTHHQMMIAGKDGEVLAIASHPTEENKGIATGHVSGTEGREIPSYDTEVVWYPKTKSLCFQPHPEFDEADDCRKYFFALLNHFVL